VYTVSELCDRFGISRKTGYKWLDRYEEEGVDGLKDRSRRPKSSPNRTPGEIEELLIEVRRAHPSWGPEKLIDVVGRRHPELELPARSTVAAILKRNGLVNGRRRRRRHRHPGRPMKEVRAANQLWTADFKGQFKTRDGRWCYPLTVADEHTRYLLACDALRSTEGKGVRPVFERLFRGHGLPESIRTDNGVPFVHSKAIHGLSSLSVWWIELGIRPERIEPGKPQQNGRHERMHRTLKDETVCPPASSLKAQQSRFDAFRQEFNHERPHQALDQKRPAEVWSPSKRAFPDRIPMPDYPQHYLLRRVFRTGHIKFKNKLLFLSQTLQKQHVALEEIEDGIWSIYFYDILLGRLDERTFELIT
jgi:transposase InsO family protein